MIIIPRRHWLGHVLKSYISLDIGKNPNNRGIAVFLLLFVMYKNMQVHTSARSHTVMVEKPGKSYLGLCKLDNTADDHVHHT